MFKRNSSSRSAGHHWVVLGVFSVLSIVGNALHALESGVGSLDPWLSAAIATIAPITLLASTHSLIIHRRDFSGWTRGVAMAITFLIASASFVLSFSALWELSTMAGIPSDRSWLMAVIIDAMVIQSTMSLVLADVVPPSAIPLLPTYDNSAGGVTVDDERPPVTSANAVWPPVGESMVAARGVSAATVDIPAAAADLAAPEDGPTVAADLNEDLMVLAARVRESSNAVMSRAAIAQALQLRLAGQSLREIARAVGVRSHSTIGDWVRVAAKVDARFDSASATEDRIEESDVQPLRV